MDEGIYLRGNTCKRSVGCRRAMIKFIDLVVTGLFCVTYAWSCAICYIGVQNLIFPKQKTLTLLTRPINVLLH